jgi:hypothetical protein
LPYGTSGLNPQTIGRGRTRIIEAAALRPPAQTNSHESRLTGQQPRPLAPEVIHDRLPCVLPAGRRAPPPSRGRGRLIADREAGQGRCSARGKRRPLRNSRHGESALVVPTPLVVAARTSDKTRRAPLRAVVVAVTTRKMMEAASGPLTGGTKWTPVVRQHDSPEAGSIHACPTAFAGDRAAVLSAARKGESMPRQKSLLTVIRDLVQQEVRSAIQSLLGSGSPAKPAKNGRRRRRRTRGTWRPGGPGRPPKAVAEKMAHTKRSVATPVAPKPKIVRRRRRRRRGPGRPPGSKKKVA